MPDWVADGAVWSHPVSAKGISGIPKGTTLLPITYADVTLSNGVVSKNTNELKTHTPGRFGWEVSTLGWQWELE